jgi:hypothetical protein
MKNIITTILGLMAICVTIFSGMLHGRIRYEFGLGQDLTEQVKVVESLPPEFGQTEDGRPAWVMVGEQQELDDEVVELLECSGYYQAAYRSTLHPEWVVQLLLMVGPSGPLLVHSPDVCYPAAGNQLLSGPERVEVTLSGGESAELQAMMFKQWRLEGAKVRVGYAFSTGKEWQSPTDARRHFAGAPYLYKMQLHTTLPADFKLSDKVDPIAYFVSSFGSPAQRPEGQ